MVIRSVLSALWNIRVQLLSATIIQGTMMLRSKSV